MRCCDHTADPQFSLEKFLQGRAADRDGFPFEISSCLGPLLSMLAVKSGIDAQLDASVLVETYLIAGCCPYIAQAKHRLRKTTKPSEPTIGTTLISKMTMSDNAQSNGLPSTSHYRTMVPLEGKVVSTRSTTIMGHSNLTAAIRSPSRAPPQAWVSPQPIS